MDKKKVDVEGREKEKEKGKETKRRKSLRRERRMCDFLTYFCVCMLCMYMYECMNYHKYFVSLWNLMSEEKGR